MKPKILYILACALLFLVGCGVFAATNVDAKLEDDDIRSGSSTTIIVDAENDKNSVLQGYFDIVPDSPQVTVAKDGRVFDIKAKETTGEKRYVISAYTTSKEQQFEISVYFRDAQTHKVLGQDKVVLQVYK